MVLGRYGQARSKIAISTVQSGAMRARGAGSRGSCMHAAWCMQDPRDLGIRISRAGIPCMVLPVQMYLYRYKYKQRVHKLKYSTVSVLVQYPVPVFLLLLKKAILASISLY